MHMRSQAFESERPCSRGTRGNRQTCGSGRRGRREQTQQQIWPWRRREATVQRERSHGKEQTDCS